MLSPRLAELHRDAFIDDGCPSTVDLAALRSDSDLDDLDLDDPDDADN